MNWFLISSQEKFEIWWFQSIAIIIFEVQIVPFMATRRYFKLAAVTFAMTIAVLYNFLPIWYEKI